VYSRQFYTESTFNKFIVISVSISTVEVFFDKHGMKASGQYYRNILRSKNNASCYQNTAAENNYFIFSKTAHQNILHATQLNC